MDFDTFLKIAFVVVTIVSYGIYRFASKNAYIRSKKYRAERYMK